MIGKDSIGNLIYRYSNTVTKTYKCNASKYMDPSFSIKQSLSMLLNILVPNFSLRAGRSNTQDQVQSDSGSHLILNLRACLHGAIVTEVKGLDDRHG